MPRTPPSGADAELIQALAERGVQVSAYQLERWRAAGHLPRHPRRSLGRGRGTRSYLLPATVNQAEALARASQQGRAPQSVVAGALFQGLRADSPSALRAVIIGHLQQTAAESGVDIERSPVESDLSDEAWDAKAEAALEMAERRARHAKEPLQMHNLLLDLAAEMGLNVDGIPRMPDWRQVRPLMAMVLRVEAIGPDAVGLDEVAEAVGAGLGLPEALIEDMKRSMAANQVEKLLHGEAADPLSTVDVRTKIAAVEAATDRELMEATAAVTLAADYQVLAFLGLLVHLDPLEGTPLTMQPESLVRMLQHPTWISWGQFITPGVRNRERDMAVMIANTLQPREYVSVHTLRVYLRFLRVALGLSDEDILDTDFPEPMAQPEPGPPGHRPDRGGGRRRLPRRLPVLASESRIRRRARPRTADLPCGIRPGPMALCHSMATRSQHH